MRTVTRRVGLGKGVPQGVETAVGAHEKPIWSSHSSILVEAAVWVWKKPECAWPLCVCCWLTAWAEAASARSLALLQPRTGVNDTCSLVWLSAATAHARGCSPRCDAGVAGAEGSA